MQSWRGEPRRLSEVTIALAIRRFAASPAEDFIGVTRNDRGMDRVAEALGCRAIGKLTLHGIESNIVCCPRFSLPVFDPEIEQIWRRSTRLGG
jgi:hypothetical protein